DRAVSGRHQPGRTASMKDSTTMNETGSAVASRRRIQDNKPRPAPAPDAQAQHDLKLLLAALSALKQGDSSVRLPFEWTGMHGKIAETFNEVVELNGRMAEELARLREKVGKE